MAPNNPLGFSGILATVFLSNFGQCGEGFAHRFYPFKGLSVALTLRVALSHPVSLVTLLPLPSQVTESLLTTSGLHSYKLLSPATLTI